jgi:uncharacterized protein (DUF4415 family)
MNKTEKDYEYLETSEEMKARGLSRISRPKFLDNIPQNIQLRDCKSRITMDVDADIIEYFKQEAARQDKNYQTLINNLLREFVDGRREISAKENFKRELLQDRDFLQKLKEALV